MKSKRREIKFRAWYNKKMIKSFDLFTVPNYLGESLAIRTPTFMQYTGLKDKNGKEIYEGDIVKGSWGYYTEPTEVKFNDIIYWDAECTLSEDIEVIGNIYENPELLEEKK